MDRFSRSLRARASTRLRHVLAPLTHDGYEILTDLSMRHGHVDLVVAGPSGVYVVETKGWRGRAQVAKGSRLVCGGIGRGAAVRRALDQARFVRRQLAASGVDFPVMPVLALANARLPEGPIDLRTLLVARVDDVASMIRRRPRRLDTVKILMIRDELAPLAERT